MARPRINAKNRSIPISFSVKPKLAEKIEEYSHQLRFSRSKFLAQAVQEAITKIDMGYDAVDYDVRNMTDNQRLASALNALNNPTPEQEINPNIIKNLKEAIDRYELMTLIDELDTTNFPKVTVRSDDVNIDFTRTRAGRYEVYNNGTRIGTIIKETENEPENWVLYVDDEETTHRTLSDAKNAILRMWGVE